jgi:hypothetical protein
MQKYARRMRMYIGRVDNTIATLQDLTLGKGFSRNLYGQRGEEVHGIYSDLSL